MSGVLRVWRELGVAYLALAALIGCSSPETQLIVVTYTNLKIPRDIDAIEVVVTGPDDMQTTVSASLVGDEAIEQPFTLALTPKGEALGPVTVVVRGMSGTTEVLGRTARTEFVQGQSRLLRLDLLTACMGVTCPSDQTCDNGACTPIEVEGAFLPPFEGTLPPRVVTDASADASDVGTPDTSAPMDSAVMDSSVPTDTGAPDTGAPDTGSPPTDSAVMDTGSPPMDTGSPDTMPPMDSGVTCPPMTTPLPRTGSVNVMGNLTPTRTFSHVTFPSCPSTATSFDYAYESFVYCNDGPLAVWDIFQEGTDTNPSFTLEDPWIVVYDGMGIPADTGMCLDTSDDYGAGYDSRVTLVLDPGQVITVAASSYCDVTDAECGFPGLGTYRLRIVAR